MELLFIVRLLHQLKLLRIDVLLSESLIHIDSIEASDEIAIEVLEVHLLAWLERQLLGVVFLRVCFVSCL